MTKKQELPHISKRIVALREARGMSQKDLGTLAGVTAPAITMWETGKRFPRGKNLANLAKALGVSEAAIMDDSPISDFVSKNDPTDRPSLILEIQDLLKVLSQDDLEALKASAENMAELASKSLASRSKKN